VARGMESGSSRLVKVAYVMDGLKDGAVCSTNSFLRHLCRDVNTLTVLFLIFFSQ
jgi:hypothetical protein